MQRSITIVGRRWFQKYYGNTYNSVRIDVQTPSGCWSRYLPPTYGYGDYYVQRATEWLREHFPPIRNCSNHLSIFARENDWHLTYYAQDVDRERDL